MNSGPNQPSGNGGGRGRRRRRGRRGHGGSQPSQGQPQGQNSQQSQGHGGQHQSGPRPHGQHQGGQNRNQQNRRFGKQPRRQNRGPMNSRIPDAGIYSAPMDHSYRQALGDDLGNGNGNGRQKPNGNGANGDAGTTNGNKPIYAFVDDLFFLAKIQETARKLGVKVDFVKAEKEVLDTILEKEEKPALIIFDLNSNSGKPLLAIPKLKAKLKKDTNIIGFLSHIQGDLKVKAMEAGCDMVVPRSAFSQNLPNILRRHADDGIQDGLDVQPM